MKTHFPAFLRQLLISLVLIFVCAFSTTALAQTHGVGVGKVCPVATKPGDIAVCLLEVRNEDGFGDTIEVIEFWDVVDPGGPNQFRNPAVGNLSITEVSAGVVCAEDLGEPIGLTFPCLLDGAPGTGGSGEFVRVMSEYIVPASATDPLLDQGNTIVRDVCDVQPIGCNPNNQQLQFGAAVSLFMPSIDVSKTGPEIAKVGDTVTYTIGFTDTTTGTAFPGFATCSGSDTVLGDLGEFEAGVSRQFDYTIQPGDPNPLVNVATINCSIDNFDNIVSDSDSHSLNTFSPSVSVSKTGPDLAKAGDTVTYTVTLTNTSSDGTPDLSCSANDSLIGPIADFGFGDNNYDYTIPADASGPIVNEVEVICDITGFDNQVGDDDSHTLQLFNPAVTVKKYGPDLAKAGDTVTYTVKLENASSGNTPELSCSAIDSLLGPLPDFGFGENHYDYTIPGDAQGPIVNEVEVTCDIAGFDNQVGGDASHTLELFNPAVTVKKYGPDVAKAGDTVTYTVKLENASSANTPELSCTAYDSLVGNIPGFGFGENHYDYTIPGDAEGPIVNHVDVSCDIAGFDNQVGGDASHSLDLISPSVTLTKICQPDPVQVGETIEWLITVTNTGDSELDCQLNDPEAGIVDAPLLLLPGDDETVDASRTVSASDFPLISNTATVMCDVAGFDNQVEASDTADCEVTPLVQEVCRTPGFWGTHAGTEHRRATNLTQMVIDYGGPLSVCGATIDNTDVGNVFSAVEAMCVRIQGVQQRQLARQLTAMALNCIVSGGDADCAGTSVEGLFADANAACEADDTNLSYFIGLVDCFNNGGQYNEMTQQCSISNDNNCQHRDLDYATSIFDGVHPLPGPAGSSRACRDANGNGVKVVPAP